MIKHSDDGRREAGGGADNPLDFRGFPAGLSEGSATDGGAANDAFANFEIYVDDERYSVPTLYLVADTDEASAVRAAEACLADGRHHRSVELWQAGRQVLVLGSRYRRGQT